MAKSKGIDFQLSVYGYGMMALSSTILVLLLNGFFHRIGLDLLAVWFVVGLAAASGALALALIKYNLPHLKKPVAITYTMLLFIILLGSYLTSFFGYSEAYVSYFVRPADHSFSFEGFMRGLGNVWLGVTIISIACTITYMIIQLLSSQKQETLHPVSDSEEIDGLAE